MSTLFQVAQSRVLVGLLIASAVAVAAVGLRDKGSLEALELRSYDWGLRLRPGVSEPDLRILLIQITEDEITNPSYGYPIRDGVLAEALEILGEANPRAIGVDLYRDVLYPPGSKRLERIFKSNPAIVIVNKFEEIPAPAFVPEHQVGFADLPHDPDSVVRRYLLYLWGDEQPGRSLGLVLAERYLSHERIRIDAAPNRPEWVRLGETVLPPVEGYEGGYAVADSSGYSFLLDYRQGRTPFQSFRLSDVLEHRVPQRMVEGRVVLIGTIAVSVPDHHRTPYAGYGDPMYGLEIHASAVSQLLRIAYEESEPVSGLGNRSELGLIMLYALLGVLGGAFAQSGRRTAIHLLVLPVACLAPLLIGLRSNFWIPVVAPAFAWLGGGALMAAYALRIERWWVGLVTSAQAWWQRRRRTAEGSAEVFISYATEDTGWAKTVLNALEANGISGWLAPRELKAGEEFGEEIVRAIRSCRLVIILLSKSANESKYVVNELIQALDHSRKRLLVRLEDVEPSDRLKLFVGDVHWKLDLFDGPPAQELSKLTERVRAAIR